MSQLKSVQQPGRHARSLGFALFATILTALPGVAFAQDGAVDVADSGDTAWLLAATALVLLAAAPGMALFNGGRLNAQNFLSLLFQQAAILAAVSLAWIVVGYTIAFGEVTTGWLGSGSAWMLITLGNVRIGTYVPESAFALHEIVVAGLTASLMCGAWAGRARFGWAVAFAALWSVVAYAPVAHWLKGGGWLATSVGVIDFGGGITMAVCAGVSALVAAMLVGKRHGFPHQVPSRFSPSMVLLGAGMSWVGWFGLAGGAALAANDDAAAVLINIHAAACAGGLGWMALDRFRRRKPSTVRFATGIVAGLIAILSGALYVSPGAAMVIGFSGVVASRLTRSLIHRYTAIDDALDVFALFAASGATGAVLTAVFLSQSLGGVGYDEGMNAIAQVVAQVLGIGVVAIWSMLVSAVLAIMVSLIVPMRVSEDAEANGLDVSTHGEHA